ncbi:MAG TPA: N-acetyltransferase [Cellvibrionaceae bacterium]
MIRVYKNSDFSEVEDIYNLPKKDEFFGNDFDVAITPLSQDQHMLHLFFESRIFVYESNGVVGFVGVKGNHISWLFVHPDFRGQGFAKKLVLSALSELKGEVTLNVASSNAIAISVYDSLGFEVIAEFSGKYQCNSVNVLRMSKYIR